MSKGVNFAVCDMATHFFAGYISDKTKANVDAVYRELTASLIPNAHLVPAGIVAVNRAQEHGYTFAYAAMGLSVGIVGLPNVGKSTLFNALSTAKAEAANYPFCTIEPNVGVVSVPDARLDALDSVVHADKIVPTTIDFVDIAGLVRGASKGEGLGNQFLAHIREVDAIVQVVRCFEDANVIHVENRVDPVGRHRAPSRPSSA